MDKLKITFTAILLGALYSYLSIYIIGIGAAIAIPSNIIEPLMSSVPLLAFAMIDIFTLGLPLILIYFLFVIVFKYLCPTSGYMSYAILFIPFCIQHVYIFLMMGTPQDWTFTLSTVVPRYILIVFFAFVFTKQAMKRAGSFNNG